MKNFKIFMCIIFSIIIGTFSSTISNGMSKETNDSTKSFAGSVIPDTQRKLVFSDSMIILPKYNCDPKMLIPGNPNIDPEFLVKPK